MTTDILDTENWYSAEASTFGDRMAGARERSGLTQADLARRLGVKVSAIASWEEDLSEPRANKLQMLSGILNVSVTWLLDARGEGLDGPEADMPAPEDVDHLLTELRQIRSEMLAFTRRLAVLEKRLSLARNREF